MIKTLSFSEFKKLYPSHYNALCSQFHKSVITDFETDENYIVHFDPVSNRFEIGYPSDYFILK